MSGTRPWVHIAAPQQDCVSVQHMYEAEALNEIPATAYHMVVVEPLTIYNTWVSK